MTFKPLMLALTLGVMASGALLAGGVQAQPRGHADTAYGRGYQDGRADERYRDSRQARRGYDSRWHGGADTAGYLFRAMDRNDNGRVSLREFRQQYGEGRRVSRTFGQLDANRDGQLSTWEVRNGAGVLHRLG